MMGEHAERAAHVGKTIARQAMEDVFAQTQIEGMDQLQQVVAAAAAAEEVFLIVAQLGERAGATADAVALAESYSKMGVARALGQG
jgi:hypothetical protein